MSPSIGLNLRVTGYKHQGGRRYMEDDFGVAYQQTADEKDLEYAFFGIFDGHGGREAAVFAKAHLMDFIVSQKGFWEDDDDAVLKAIHEGYIQTHYAMWKELEKWPKTASGLPSTAGTTASIAFIRRGKIYVGHVGDSAIILGVQDPENPDIWRADPLTIDHKPESIEESERIQQCGGKVICKSGVPRVVWNRPRMGHKGPVRRSTHIDEIPFLAVARSLGDLWSFNSEENVFVVSPEPDIRVYPIDITKHRCLILATDGAWNMLTPQNAISTVCQAEKSNEQHMLNPVEGRTCWINPSKQLVDTAIDRWNTSKLRADNTSVVTVMLDPPGPPRAQVLKNRKRELAALNAGKDLPGQIGEGDRGSVALVTNTTQEAAAAATAAPKVGCSIISRFPNSQHPVHSVGVDLLHQKKLAEESPENNTPPYLTRDLNTSGTGGRLSDSTMLKKTTTPATPSVQCNEVSSSEDPSPSREATTTRTSAPVPEPLTTNSSPLSELKNTVVPSSSSHLSLQKTPRQKSLARELSALALSSPRSTRGSTRARTRSENNSDTENDATSDNKSNNRRLSKAKTPAKSRDNKPALSLVKQRCQEINAKIEKASAAASIGRRMTRGGTGGVMLESQDQQHNLRSASKPRLGATPSRSLRARGAATPSTPILSALKRKRGAGSSLEAAGGPAKSPRTMAVKKPVVTRSKHATVKVLK